MAEIKQCGSYAAPKHYAVEALMHLPDALLIFKDSQVVFANMKAAEIFHFDTPWEMLNQPCSMISGSTVCHHHLDDLLHQAKEQSPTGFLKWAAFEMKHIATAGVVYYALLEGDLLLLMFKNEQNMTEDPEKFEPLSESRFALKNVREQMVSQEKMATLGQLITGIAHEIFNPLGYIMSNIDTMRIYHKSLIAYTEALKRLISEQGGSALEQEAELLYKKMDIDFICKDNEDMFSDIGEGVSRINGIIKGLKSFSRKSAEPLDYDLNSGLQTSLLIAKNEYKYVAEVELELGELPLIMADGNSINQVFLNLIINAAHAIKETTDGRKGLIRIRTYVNANEVCVTLSDNGKGIPKALQTKIFDPFFTTKAEGTGTGLGLSIAYEIVVEQHRGRMEFSSEESVGTTFLIALPVDSAEEDLGQAEGRAFDR